MKRRALFGLMFTPLLVVAKPTRHLVAVSDARLRDWANPCKVFVDGRHVPGCYKYKLYSDGTGVVYYYAQDSRGEYAHVNNGHGFEIARGVAYGEVTTQPLPEASWMKLIVESYDQRTNQLEVARLMETTPCV